MAWLAVDKDGTEKIFDEGPFRREGGGYDDWDTSDWDDSCIKLPKGSIKKLIGRELTWEDEAVEI